MRYEDYMTVGVAWNTHRRAVLFIPCDSITPSLVTGTIQKIIMESTKLDKYGFRNEENCRNHKGMDDMARQHHRASAMMAESLREVGCGITKLTRKYFLEHGYDAMAGNGKYLIAASPMELSILQDLNKPDFLIDFYEKRIFGLQNLFRVYHYDPQNAELRKDAAFNGIISMERFLEEDMDIGLNMNMDEEEILCKWIYRFKRPGIPFAELQEAEDYISGFQTKRYTQEYKPPLNIALAVNLAEGDVVSKVMPQNMAG